MDPARREARILKRVKVLSASTQQIASYMSEDLDIFPASQEDPSDAESAWVAFKVMIHKIAWSYWCLSNAS